ncbi:xylulokinase [Lactococcus garvieae]|uniref:xylulokinase n=1 Tax=Lactococcus garvieae TaxID=1363 RepID=UPI001F61A6F2|nr:xylulokinase [Lactococcus garvieae]MCI3860390.1 xylulokinase [Lactococcus garvieae]
MVYVLGVDLGTSSLKGILMDERGKLIATKSAEYKLDTPQSGYSEQHPEYWIKALDTVLVGLSDEITDFGQELVALSFSGQMHSLVALDKDEKPVYPAILWNDVRTSKQCQEITEKLGNRLLEITKNIALEGFTLPKILWLQENEPEVWARVAKIMLPKDYLSLWLTGNTYTEYSDAAGTLLLDVEKREWSKEIAQIFGIDLLILPELIESTGQTGKIKPEIVQRYKINENVKVFAGGADNAAAALGAGLINGEIGLISMGTSGVVSAFEPRILNYKGKLHFFNHAVAGAYYSMGVTLAAGNSLSWYKETFNGSLSFKELLAEVSSISPGSDGLLFTPYIVGERTPHFDSKIRGSFLGISAHHNQHHFSRAVLEGITFSLRDSKDMMEAVKGHKFKRLVSVGGGAQNVDIMQMQANICNSEIISLTVEQGPGLGACMIAAMGYGLFDSLEEVTKAFVHYKEATFIPQDKVVEHYEKLYQVWKNVYNTTADISHQLVQIQIPQT